MRIIIHTKGRSYRFWLPFFVFWFKQAREEIPEVTKILRAAIEGDLDKFNMIQTGFGQKIVHFKPSEITAIKVKGCLAGRIR